MILRLAPLAASLVLSTIVLQSCSCQSPFEFAVHGRTASLASILDADISPDQLAVQLREFQNGASDQQKNEASYILARMLQKNVVFDSRSKDPKTNGSDRLTEAIRLFDEGSEVPSLAERSAWHISEIATTIGDEERGRTALEYIKRKSTDPDTKARAEYLIAQSYLRTNDEDKAQPLFLDLRKQFPATEYGKGAIFYLAEHEMSAPQPTDEAIQNALGFYRQYIKASPDGRFALDALNKLNALAKNGSVQLIESDHDAMGTIYFARGRWNDALTEWSKAKSDAHLIKRAICLANLGNSHDAQKTLLQAIAAQPGVPYEATAALISNALNREDTKRFWQDILNARPAKADAPLWNIALRSEPPQAIPLYRKIIANYPSSEFAPECVWWTFWYYAKQSRSDRSSAASALALAKEGLTKYPNSKAAARLGFWAGKLHEQLKQPAEARVAYQFSATHFPAYYYGHRARARLKKLGEKAPDAVADPKSDPGWSTKPARVPPNLKWHWPAPQSIVSFEHMEKKYGATIMELVKLHQYDEAFELLPDEVGPEFKASLLAKMQKPLQAINAANKDLTGTPKLTERWEMSYPLEFADQIARDASSNGVDPLLVHALIREESRYNPDALSRSKAIGLMQLLPGTAYGVAKRLNVPLSSKQDVFKPEINIKLGTNYLAYTLKRFNGNALLAVASYNGGPNAVQSWSTNPKLSGSGDFDTFVENIPFRETRDYVRKVFGSYWTYEEIYGHKTI